MSGVVSAKVCCGKKGCFSPMFVAHKDALQLSRRHNAVDTKKARELRKNSNHPHQCGQKNLKHRSE